MTFDILEEKLRQVTRDNLAKLSDNGSPKRT